MIDAELIERLQGLAKCEQGHKYNVKTKKSSHGKSWWTTGERIWYGQGRNTLLEELEDIVKAIQKEIKDSEMLGKNISELPFYIEQAADGLFNVSMAYIGDDQDIVAEINKKIGEFRTFASFIRRNYTPNTGPINIHRKNSSSSSSNNTPKPGSSPLPDTKPPTTFKVGSVGNPYNNIPGSSPNSFPFSRLILTSDKYTPEDVQRFNEFISKKDDKN